MSKRSCKKIFDHYNAIPSLSGDCHYKFWISDLFIDFVRTACSHSYWFSQLPGSPLRSWTQVKLWGTTTDRVVQGNLGRSPWKGTFAKQSTQSKSPIRRLCLAGLRLKCF